MHVLTSWNSSHVQLLLLYLDPGSGSLIIQLVIGALLAIGLTIRIFWSRIKAFLLRNKTGAEPPIPGEVEKPKTDERR